MLAASGAAPQNLPNCGDPAGDAAARSRLPGTPGGAHGLGDTSLPRDFLFGMKAVGIASVYWVFPEQRAEDIRLASLFQNAEEHNRQVRSQLRPGKDDTLMLAHSRKDADAGFCTQPLTHAQLLRKVQGQPVRLIPRCVITQSSGKQRIIDNADVGGQSKRSLIPTS